MGREWRKERDPRAKRDMVRGGERLDQDARAEKRMRMHEWDAPGDVCGERSAAATTTDKREGEEGHEGREEKRTFGRLDE